MDDTDVIVALANFLGLYYWVTLALGWFVVYVLVTQFFKIFAAVYFIFGTGYISYAKFSDWSGYDWSLGFESMTHSFVMLIVLAVLPFILITMLGMAGDASHRGDYDD